MKKSFLKLIMSLFVALILLASVPAAADGPIDRKGRNYTEKLPYGDYCPKRHGRYGATRAVESEAEARSFLNEYFRDRDLSIGSIEKRRWFFRAEIFDPSGNLVDIIIIDRRTGRIRSTL